MPEQTPADTSVDKTKSPPADDKKGGDDFTNLKAEMARKMSNLETSNKAIADQLKAIAGAIPKAPPPKEKQSSIKDVWWDDPEAAANKIKEDTRASVMDQIRAEQASLNSRNTVITGLYNDYPELADIEHPLTKKAVEIFDGLPEHERNSPLAYRLAVKEAAMELKVQKRKDRSPDSDDFSGLSGGAGSGTGRKRREPDLDPRTVDFAKMVGLDTEDPKIMESLKKKAARKTWQRWE